MPLPIVLWTHQSNGWWKLRGIAGDVSTWLRLPVSRLPLVGSAPSRTGRGAVDYDRVSGVVYWSQSSATTSSNSWWSLGAQPLKDALAWTGTSPVRDVILSLCSVLIIPVRNVWQSLGCSLPGLAVSSPGE